MSIRNLPGIIIQVMIREGSALSQFHKTEQIEADVFQYILR